jgi:RimJ/RimL family protein N-acetyltransferase
MWQLASVELHEKVWKTLTRRFLGKTLNMAVMEALKQDVRSSGIVPIRSLGAAHRQRIATHLLALDEHDRYLRFGYAASDEQIERYVEGLDFERDDIFGIFNRKLELIAMAHLAFLIGEAGAPAGAEFGVSVLSYARGRGYGARLFERAGVHARNEGVELIFIHALSENTAMIRIARNAGATLERAGSETDAYLRLPPATLDTRVSEILDEQMAQADYRLKRQAKSLLDFLRQLQEIRRGAVDALGKSGR